MTIEGAGTFDLNDSQFYDFTRPRAAVSRVLLTAEQLAECTVEREWRPNQSIFFHKVKGLKVRGITVLDAPCWTITFSECENVMVQGLTVDTSLNVPNDDGMHFCSCNGVIISDCHISSGYNCIAISGITNWAKPCENIVITNCVLRSCSKALVLGYVYSHIRNVLIDNVLIRESNRGLTFMCNANGGLVENVRAKNLIIDTRIRAGDWWGNGEPIFFMGVEHDQIIPPEQDPHRETPVNFRRIYIEDVTCTGENAIGAVGTGGNFDEVCLRNISYERKPSKNLPLKGSTFDIAPAPEPVDVPEDRAVYIKGAGNLTLENITARDYNGKAQRIVIE